MNAIIGTLSPESRAGQAPLLLGVANGRAWVAPDRHDGQDPIELDLHIDGLFVGRLDGAASCPAQEALLQFADVVAGNQLANSDFGAGTDCWSLAAASPQIEFGVALRPEWNIKDGATAYVRQIDDDPALEAGVTYQDPAEGGQITVSAGRRYVFSGYFARHRCSAYLEVLYFDAEGRRLSPFRAPIDVDAIGGEAISDYEQVTVAFTPPPGARAAALTIVKSGTVKKSGKAGSALLFTHLHFGRARDGEDVEWKPAVHGPDIVKALREVDANARSVLSVELPAKVFDGVHHAVDVRDAATGRSIACSPTSFRAIDDLEAQIEAIQDGAVVGWAQSGSAERRSAKLRLLVDGIEVASGLANQKHARRPGCGFRLVLPTPLLDGRPHLIQVISAYGGRTLAENAEILPAIVTPIETLQKYSRWPRPWFYPAARYRYAGYDEAVDAALRTAASHGAAAALEELKQVRLAHDVLMKGFAQLSAPYAPLAFPAVDSPAVSVVVPAHNKFNVTYFCFCALLFAKTKASFEVILVDDGSSDETAQAETLVQGIKVVRNGSAEGFVSACNAGADQARGKYIVFLNNDTEVTAGWLDALVEVFESFADVGIAGGKLLFADGRLQEAGGIVWGGGDPWNYGRDQNPEDPRFNYVRQVDYLSGACLMISAELWRDVGGFGEEFRPGYFEDTDLCFKAKNAGKKVVYTPFCVVYHFEGLSSGTDLAAGMKRFQEINRPKFKRRWRSLYRHNGETGVDVELNKDRGVCGRVLMLDVQFPRGENDAGSYAALQEIRLIQSLGFKVTFAPLNLTYLGRHTERLQRMGVETIYAPFARSLEEILHKRGKEFDAVYITRYSVARRTIEAIREHAPKARILFCNADLHFLREIREALARGSDELKARAERTRDAELDVVSAADVTLSYNFVEHAVIESHRPGAKVVLAPWVVDTPGHAPDFELRKDIAYLGGFEHAPNRLAVEFFANEVLPILRAEGSCGEFLVYGSGLNGKDHAFAQEGVRLMGYVDDIRSAYDSCRVFVAPLVSGAGLKGKVVDALALGTPSVISPIAAEGTSLQDGVEVFIARTPLEWAQAVRRLYGDKDLWRAMSAAAQAYARRNYSFARGQILMERAFEAAGVPAAADPGALVLNRTRFEA